MRGTIVMVLVVLAGWTAASSAAPVQTEPDGPDLRVGIREVPPFVIGETAGWTGISIELWESIADGLDLQWEYVEMDLPTLLQALEQGTIDVGVGALTQTDERERLFDYTHPFHSAGLAVATGGERGSRWGRAIRRMFSPRFVRILGAFALVILAGGMLLWAAERRGNPQQFGGSAARGIGAGFWWSAVTMTTVGYGDKAPRTFLGRVIAIVWMFAGITLLATFTAALTSALTVENIRSGVTGPQDLPRVRVATVSSTTSERYLRRRGIRHRSLPSVNEALDLLVAREVDAVVYDAPMLRYQIGLRTEPLRVLPMLLTHESYALGLPEESPYIEQLNLGLLGEIGEASWDETLNRYLGSRW
ncbi:MAG: transporter substrate-binding domain-containing protein [Planctomycetota bacterium]